MTRLTDEDFLQVIRTTPLVSIDLLLHCEGDVLLGKRSNEPARGFWFVPGGRILKGERLGMAFARICQDELGLKLDFSRARLHGVYEHFYETNNFGDEGLTTHYVVLAYVLTLEEKPDIRADSQHRELAWFARDKVGRIAHVHPYTQAYFMHAS